MRNVMIAVLLMLGLMPDTSGAFVTDSVQPGRTVGPEIAQIPMWSIGVVLPGDEFEKNICVPLLRDNQILAMTAADCTRDIATVNNLSLWQLDHINPGERYWVPSPRNTFIGISEQIQKRTTLLTLTKNPLGIVLGVEQLREEVDGLRSSVQNFQTSVPTQDEMNQLITRSIDTRLAGLPKVNAVSPEEMSVLMHQAIADAMNKASVPVALNSVKIEALTERITKNEDALATLRLQLADKADKLENKNVEVLARLTQNETALSNLQSELANKANKSDIPIPATNSSSSTDNLLLGWPLWVGLFLLILLILILLYLLFSKVSRPAVRKIVKDSLTPLEEKIGEVQSDLERQNKKIDILIAYFEEDTGFISNLPTQAQLNNLAVGTMIKIMFNGERSELNFKVENDARNPGTNGLRVLDWPMEWNQPKRSLIALRRSAIVAVVKEYNYKKDAPLQSARQAS